MLDAFIIEQIKRREDEERDLERPALHLPLLDEEKQDLEPIDYDDEPKRVIIIDI